ncbi:MAG: hypothetical protein KGJ13_00495 [Patescibacteria group bacterium]|nr:hypothetical protein [Patescibacteria group bacterium]
MNQFKKKMPVELALQLLELAAEDRKLAIGNKLPYLTGAMHGYLRIIGESIAAPAHKQLALKKLEILEARSDNLPYQVAETIQNVAQNLRAELDHPMVNGDKKLPLELTMRLLESTMEKFEPKCRHKFVYLGGQIQAYLKIIDGAVISPGGKGIILRRLERILQNQKTPIPLETRKIILEVIQNLQYELDHGYPGLTAPSSSL